MFLPPMLHSWDGVLGVVCILLPPPNIVREFTPKRCVLVSSDHVAFSHPPLDHPDGQWQTSNGSGMCWLEQGDLACAAGMEECVTYGNL